MRQLASYSLETSRGDNANLQTTLNIANSWLQGKGELIGTQLSFPDGRNADIERSSVHCAIGQIERIAFSEPIENGVFTTAIEIAEKADVVILSVQLAAESASLTPQWLDVRRPTVVLKVFELPTIWRFRGSELSSKPVQFHGEDGGDRFIQLVWNEKRSVPVVAISTEYGLELHPGISAKLASDLVGVALVAQLDHDAAWRITTEKNKVWSCYGGAIRLYWPGIDAASSPFVHHKLWTPRKLLFGVDSTESAASRIRRHLRRTILSQSAFAVPQHAAFAELRRAHRMEELEALRSKAESESDYRQLADQLFDQLSKSQESIAELVEERDLLRAQNSNLELALRYQQGYVDSDEDSTLEADVEAPPATVEEAVLLASDRFADTLVFGKSAFDGIETLATGAGPPDKLFDYFEGLSSLVEALRKGALGTTIVKWLVDRGIICSGESEKVLNSKTEMARRTWDDGMGGMRQFELHLKPKEGTSPDQCVRVYFEYDESCQKVVVGWVGRHPGT